MILVGSGVGVSTVPSCVSRLPPENVLFRRLRGTPTPVALYLSWNDAVASATRDGFRALVREQTPAIRLQMEPRSRVRG